jgi:hypothetical protein
MHEPILIILEGYVTLYLHCFIAFIGGAVVMSGVKLNMTCKLLGPLCEWWVLIVNRLKCTAFIQK